MILFISERDYANMGFLLSKSLNQVGVKAISLASIPSPIRQENEQSIIYNNQKELFNFVREANVIVLMHSVKTPIGKALNKNTKIVVFHGGSRYRRNFNKHNKKFNPVVNMTLIQTGELLGLGAKNEKWLLPPIDTNFIKPTFGIHNPIIIGHYPSNKVGNEHDIKGTNSVVKVIKNLKKSSFNFDFRYKDAYTVTPRVSWKKNLKRMRKCDIYIESLNIDSTSKNQHDWSVTALEAAALGKIVITNFRNKERYLKEYGNCELLVVNSKEELRKTLIKLLKTPYDELEIIQKKTRNWVEKYHSFESIGNRLKSLMNKI